MASLPPVTPPALPPQYVNGLVCREILHQPGLHIDWHSHEVAAFALTVQGSSQESFHNARFDRLVRTVLVRPARVKHCDFVSSEGAKCFLMEFRPTWTEQFPATAAALDQLSYHSCGPFTNLASRAYREWLHNDDAAQISIQALTLEMLALLLREKNSKPGARSPFWLRRVKQRLDEGFAETPTLAELADIARVHPTHLARQFRHHYRRSIGEYLRQRRVDAAIELLASERSLTEIALDTGFSHHAHFSIVFKRLTGLTPSEFRRLSYKDYRRSH